MVASTLIVALSAAWVLSGAGKLAAPRTTASFLSQLAARRVTDRAVRVLALLEIGISIGLAAPAGRVWSALAAVLASAVILMILVRARQRPEQLPCGCFGPLVADRRVGAGHVCLVAAMLLASIAVLVLAARQPYLGTYAQAAAMIVAVGLVGGRYLRLRRTVADGGQNRQED